MYSYLQSSGVEKGHAGRSVYCDTVTAPQYGELCKNGTLFEDYNKKNKDLFSRAAGPWKVLIHKE